MIGSKRKTIGVIRELEKEGIPRDAFPRIADAGLQVTRLLKNNPRPVTRADIVDYATYEDGREALRRERAGLAAAPLRRARR